MGILEKHNRYSCVTVGVKNPIRYRGYYYDVETGLYYLQSRYYDPQTGRFINADDTDYLGADGSFASYNLFAYCSNNPVMNSDPTGYMSTGAAATAFATKYGLLSISKLALVSKITAFISSVAPYLLAAIAIIVAAYLTYKAVQTAVINKAVRKVKSTVKKNSKTRYWTATIKSGYVDIGRSLTYSQAVKEIKSGRNVFTVTSYEAKALAIAAGGSTGRNNKKLYPEKHGGKGYYWHYHTYNRKGGHVFYLF